MDYFQSSRDYGSQPEENFFGGTRSLIGIQWEEGNSECQSQLNYTNVDAYLWRNLSAKQNRSGTSCRTPILTSIITDSVHLYCSLSSRVVQQPANEWNNHLNWAHIKNHGLRIEILRCTLGGNKTNRNRSSTSIRMAVYFKRHRIAKFTRKTNHGEMPPSANLPY